MQKYWIFTYSFRQVYAHIKKYRFKLANLSKRNFRSHAAYIPQAIRLLFQTNIIYPVPNTTVIIIFFYIATYFFSPFLSQFSKYIVGEKIGGKTGTFIRTVTIYVSFFRYFYLVEKNRTDLKLSPNTYTIIISRRGTIFKKNSAVFFPLVIHNRLEFPIFFFSGFMWKL